MIRRTKGRERQPVESASSPLGPGTRAPGFHLASTTGEAVRLSDYSGQPVVLVFYPADWSPVCGDQLGLYNEVLPLFEQFGAQVLAVSVDGRWSHKAFAEQRKLRFPLLADFEPKGAVARRYGVYDENAGTSERASFVLDGDGIVRWSYVSPKGVNPGADGILNALESMSSH